MKKELTMALLLAMALGPCAARGELPQAGSILHPYGIIHQMEDLMPPPVPEGAIGILKDYAVEITPGPTGNPAEFSYAHPTATPAPTAAAEPGTLGNPYTPMTLAAALGAMGGAYALFEGVYFDPGIINAEAIYRVEAITRGDGFFQRPGWYLTCRPCDPTAGILSGIDTIRFHVPE